MTFDPVDFRTSLHDIPDYLQNIPEGFVINLSLILDKWLVPGYEDSTPTAR